ncbi:MAG: acylphosphatase [Deltaproteobacteria bacterium]|nr:acylphosphatase [Deltaproteobacteria bacterium]
MIQRRVVVSGRVQGVGFRAATSLEASRYHKLCGYVRNLPNGAVEAVFAGDENVVLSLVSWCKTGPSAARVTHLEVYEELFDSTLSTFLVR